MAEHMLTDRLAGQVNLHVLCSRPGSMHQPSRGICMPHLKPAALLKQPLTKNLFLSKSSPCIRKHQTFVRHPHLSSRASIGSETWIRFWQPCCHSHAPLDLLTSMDVCWQVVYDEASTQVWLMLHSGSRNIGNKTAQHHDGVAKQWLSDNGRTTPHGLNYAPIASEQGQQYLQVSRPAPPLCSCACNAWISDISQPSCTEPAARSCCQCLLLSMCCPNAADESCLQCCAHGFKLPMAQILDQRDPCMLGVGSACMPLLDC